MTVRFLTLLAIATAVPASAATTARVDGARYDRTNCPKQVPMAVNLKRCPALPPMLVAER